MATVVRSLISGLKFIPQKLGGQLNYVVKDPLKGKIYRFEEDEYDLLKLFNGQRTPRQVAELFNQQHTSVEVDSQTVLSFQRNLKSMNLLEVSEKEKQQLLYELKQERKQEALLRGQGSWTYRRYPLVHPDKFLEKIKPLTQAFFTPVFLIVSLLIIVTGWFQVLSHFDAFYIGMVNLITFQAGSAGDYLLLWSVAFVIVWIHELGHGICCKHYGGRVKEMGFLLMFFQPYFYADITDAWLFSEKRHKIVTVLVGVFVEAFLGAIGAWVWQLTNPESLFNAIGFQAVLICGISSVALNFNPLIKRDGYYALSDALEVPNLKSEASEYTQYLTKRYLFKENLEEPEIATRDKWLLGLYGYFSGAYMIFMMSCIYMLFSMIAEKVFGPQGHLLNVLFFWVIFKKYFIGSWRYLKSYFLLQGDDSLKRRKKLFKGICLFLLVSLFFPVDLAVTSEGLLESRRKLTIRAPENGLLSFVNTGKILSGDVLAQFQNPDLEFQVQKAKLNYDQAVLTRRQALGQQKIVEAQMAQQQAQSIQEHYQKLQQKLSSLTIAVPFVGEVKNPDIQMSVGRWFKRGEVVCEFIDDSKFMIKIELDEKDFFPQIDVGDRVELMLPNYENEIIEAKVTYIDVGVQIEKADKGVSDKRSIRIHMESQNQWTQAFPDMLVKIKIYADRTLLGYRLFQGFLKFLRLDWIF